MLIETVLGKAMGLDVAIAMDILRKNNDIHFVEDLELNLERKQQFQEETEKLFGLPTSLGLSTLNQATNHILDNRYRLAA